MHVAELAPMQRLNQLDPVERLFEHSRRPEWGVGLWVQEERTKRRMRFADGELRAFKRGYYHLLEPVEPSEVDVEEVFEEIASDHEIARREQLVAQAKKDKPPVMTFDDQLAVFEATWPGGFTGEAWRHAQRVPEEGRRPAKRHMGHHSLQAQHLLDPDTLRGLKRAKDWAEIHRRAVVVLDSSSLVSRSNDAKPVAQLQGDDRDAFAKALVALLTKDTPMPERVGKFQRRLKVRCGLNVSWQLATVFPAMVMPQEELVVRHSAVELQGRLFAPGQQVRKRPGKRAYGLAQRIANRTRRALEEAGQKPADLLDVHVFMWETLRPKALKTLEHLRG